MRDIRQSPICTIYRQRLQPGSLEPQPTATIIVTAANELLRSVHERTPVILPTEDYTQRLDPNYKDPGSQQSCYSRISQIP